MKNFILKIELFKKMEQKIEELEQQKNNIPKKLYRLKIREINKYTKQQIKLIDKKNPLEKDIEQLMQEDNNE